MCARLLRRGEEMRWRSGSARLHRVGARERRRCGVGALRAPNPSGDLAYLELVHLVLERAQRNAQILRRSCDVPAAFLERSQDEIALERVRRILEEAAPPGRARLELREMKLERQVLVRDVVLV